MDEKGICIFAYNNDKIDYVKLSIVCALLAKKNLGLPVALLTDEGTANYIEAEFNQVLIDNCFNYIITQNLVHDSNNRIHNDSPWYEFVAPFYNGNKHNVFSISPFEKTLLIDSDYLILTDNLQKIFDSGLDLSCFRTAKSIRNDLPLFGEVYLNNLGIKMWWSTVIYFTKNKDNTLFFNLWQHVKENYDYYQMLYKFPKDLYRTDFAISIAIHILNGRSQGNFMHTLPQNQMYFSVQQDNLVDVKGDSLLFLANDMQQNWKDIPVRWKNQDVHVMNKWALLRNYDNFLEYYA